MGDLSFLGINLMIACLKVFGKYPADRHALKMFFSCSIALSVHLSIISLFILLEPEAFFFVLLIIVFIYIVTSLVWKLSFILFLLTLGNALTLLMFTFI